VEQHHRDPVVERPVGHPHHLGHADRAVAAAEHREVERRQRDGPAVDVADAGDDAVRRRDQGRGAVVGRTRARQAPELDELLTGEVGDPLAGGQLAAGVLPGHLVGAGVVAQGRLRGLYVGDEGLLGGLVWRRSRHVA